jgi:hypothetical protein
MKRSSVFSTATLAATLMISGATFAASSSSVVPIGQGKYMLTGRNMTVFGSADGIAAKLMIKANEYCQKKSKSEAVLLDMAGDSSQMGQRTASSTIYFRCGTSEPAPPAQTDALPDSYYERVDNLQKQLMRGDLAVGKGFISPQASPSFAQLPESDAAMLEGRSTWWIGEDSRWFIHLQNVTTSSLEAFELSINFGSCAAPTSPVQKVIVQLSRPVPAGEQAVINFPKPISADTSGKNLCGVVSAAWASRQ